jgi:hypothetical protein
VLPKHEDQNIVKKKLLFPAMLMKQGPHSHDSSSSCSTSTTKVGGEGIASVVLQRGRLNVIGNQCIEAKPSNFHLQLLTAKQFSTHHSVNRRVRCRRPHRCCLHHSIASPPSLSLPSTVPLLIDVSTVVVRRRCLTTTSTKPVKRLTGHGLKIRIFRDEAVGELVVNWRLEGMKSWVCTRFCFYYYDTSCRHICTITSVVLRSIFLLTM